MGKMLRDKERRDTGLLVFMALVTIVFLVYIFLPGGKGKPKPEPKPDPGDQTVTHPTDTNGGQTPPIKKNTVKKPKGTGKKITKKTIEIPLTEPPPDPLKIAMDKLNGELETRLKKKYSRIVASAFPFLTYKMAGLKTKLETVEDETLRKYSKISFYDLDTLASAPLPEAYSDGLKFNALLSLFLVKLRNEGIAPKLDALPLEEFKKSIHLDFYRLLFYEIQEDYQLLPVLFYFTRLMKRIHIYPETDRTTFFKEKIKPLHDLTEGKLLVNLKELLRFSASPGRFRIRWREDDAIMGDDKNEYGNLSFRVFHFLGQSYLLFPDNKNKKSNRWLKDLIQSDPGNIELTQLEIVGENPADPVKLHKILYTPINSQFVVLLKSYNRNGGSAFLDALVTWRIENFHKELKAIDFTRAGEDKKAFKKQLADFGSYLKKNLKDALGIK